ncbi:PucR family transcriptional regulator [Bacillus massiliigorillae]|uniref:PucR family transcriptional regulator n=1 Tax=Bacillus massiliigorillae TaxID=1243664 RepID=UPI0003A42520|nr:PucR family transcriptional regulator [Bacillus massiliigorillae]
MKNTEKLTIEDVLRRPLFSSAQIVAGHEGKHNEVSWVQILDMFSENVRANKDDFILTTGLAIHDNAEVRSSYMIDLLTRDVAGLCISLGPYFQSIPSDLIEFANIHNLPIITINNSINLTDLIKDLQTQIINQQFQLNKDATEFSRTLQELTLQWADIQDIIDFLHIHTFHPIFYYPIGGKIHSIPIGSSLVSNKTIEIFKQEIIKRHNITQKPFQIKTDNEMMIICQPIICFGQTMSYIGMLLLPSQNNDYHNILLEHTNKAIAQILLRSLYVKESNLKHQNHFLLDLINQKIKNEEQAMTRMGLVPLKKGQYLFIPGLCEIEHHNISNIDSEDIETRNQSIIVLLRSLLQQQDIHSLFLNKDNKIYILCVTETTSFSSNKIIKDILNKIILQLKNTLYESANKSKIYIGFGEFKNKVTHLYESFKEALHALDVNRLLPSNEAFYEDIGMYQLIRCIHDQPLLSNFIKKHLQTIIAYDNRQKSDLLKTLSTYLKCNCSKEETAKQLYIHRQTLYRRLEKLTHLLGNDFLLPEKRLCLEVAIHFYESIPTNNTLSHNK